MYSRSVLHLCRAAGFTAATLLGTFGLASCGDDDAGSAGGDGDNGTGTDTGDGGGECGDGIVDADEECDDNNIIDGDECTNSCTNAACGDGIVWLGVEACEPALDQDCRADCTLETCGDGILDPGEECDDANTVDTDECTNDCTNSTCGDGEVQGDEECDDGNNDNMDNCTSDCMNAACGDGYLQPGEGCDDGNTEDGDGCGADCSLPSCGDGIVDPGEACDDGNADNTDACLDTCVEAVCGDGYVQDGVEVCDDGNSDNTDQCTDVCEEAACGDGYVQPGETCEPSLDPDCRADCTLESCGDGIVDPGEECDDANADESDSCLDTCRWNECGDGERYTDETDPGNPNSVEACDDGNAVNTDDCTSECLGAACGDGYIQPGNGEECDDGNDVDTDQCNNDCEPTQCGNGVVDTVLGEECDDGNQTNSDYCLNTCRFAHCGDGFKYIIPYAGPGDNPNPNEPFPEQCDDANPNNNDSCTGFCLWNICGDGYVYTDPTDSGHPMSHWPNQGVEACDDGNTNNSDSCIFFDPDQQDELFNVCAWNSCGDGYPYLNADDAGNPNPTEECDDAGSGQPDNSDSCLHTCFWNDCHDGWHYTEQTDDDNHNALEDCDDGNTSNDDGCVDECMFAGCGDGYTWLGMEGCDDGNQIPANGTTDFCGQNAQSPPLPPLPSGGAYEQMPAQVRPDAYDPDCRLPECGDGDPDTGEQCDNYGTNPGNDDSCLDTCFFNTCRDGWEYHDVEEEWSDPAVDDDEQFLNEAALHPDCDDGNSANWDDCTNECQPYRCGDGFVYFDSDGLKVEPCDDGNMDNTDSCVEGCEWNYCGDGYPYLTQTDQTNPNGLETCDDGDSDNDDYCVTNPGADNDMGTLDDIGCVLAMCGDGHVWDENSDDPMEVCDSLGDASCYNINGECRPSTCGNGVVNGDEQCDDGNDDETDDCLTRCIDPFCGDGVVWAGEEDCDDMNPDDTDSCVMELSPNESGGTGSGAAGCTWADCGDGHWYQVESDGTAPNDIEACERDLVWDQICGQGCEIQCLPGREPWAGEYDDSCYFVAEDLTYGGGQMGENIPSGDCYPLVVDWEEARVACQAYNVNADLVIITSSAENAFVENLLGECADALNTADLYGPQDVGFGWLGMRDLSFDTGAADPDGDWFWIDGNPMSFEDWYTFVDQPNDCCLSQPDVPVDLPGQQQCGSMWVGSSEGWRDWDCYWGQDTVEDNGSEPIPYPHYPHFALCEVSMDLG